MTSTHPLLRSLGGVLGILEAVVPPFIFVIVFAFSSKEPGLPWAAMIVSGAASIAFIVVRLVRRENLTQAIAGLLAVAASVILAATTNKAENNFVLGIWTNAFYAIAFTVSVFVRWPLVGIGVAFIAKRAHDWRSNPHQRKVMTWLTWMWVAMFVIRLAVEVPLYFAGNVEGLALAKLILGMPLYAPVVVVTWLFVRGMFIEEKEQESPASE